MRKFIKWVRLLALGPLFLFGIMGTTGGGGSTPPSGSDDEPPTDSPTGAGDPPKGAIQFTPEQQAHIDQIIGERLKRAQETWQAKQEAAQKKAAEEAEQKRLEEQAEWQKLAEQQKTRLAELEPLAPRLKEYQETIQQLLEARLKELGEKAQQAVEGLPGEPDALTQLQWLDANAELFAEKDKGPGTPPRQRGTSPSPDPTRQAPRPVIRF